jgi:hypothetical protein
METPTLTPATRPGFFRRLFSWRTARKVLFVFAALITLGALFFAEEHWRGSRAWANYKRDMEAKGERFDAARLIPPKVPDDQNFAMTPYFAPILNLTPEDLRQPPKLVTNMVDGQVMEGEMDERRGTNIANHLPNGVSTPRRFTWQYPLATDLLLWAVEFKGTNSATLSPAITDPVQAASIVLDGLKACEPTLAELQAASARPSCRFNIPYEEWDNPHVQSALMEHWDVVKGLYRVLSLHAETEMVLGQTGQALKDLNVLFRMDDGLKEEPLLMSQLVRIADVTVLLGAVGQGLAEHRWSDDQLQILQARLLMTDLIASTVFALHGERDMCSNQKSYQGDILPNGWDRLEQLNINRAFQESVFPRIDLAEREINPSVNHSIDLAVQKSHKGFFSHMIHHDILATMLMPVYSKFPQKVALAQSGVDMAMLACALERYRLAHGQYPEELNALVPGFVAVLPHDIINGQPLKYRRTDNGRFILYSVGWNEKDDGGVVVTKGNPPRQDPLQGDWVWQYPEKL